MGIAEHISVIVKLKIEAYGEKCKEAGTNCYKQLDTKFSETVYGWGVRSARGYINTPQSIRNMSPLTLSLFSKNNRGETEMRLS